MGIVVTRGSEHGRGAVRLVFFAGVFNVDIALIAVVRIHVRVRVRVHVRILIHAGCLFERIHDGPQNTLLLCLLHVCLGSRICRRIATSCGSENVIIGIAIAIGIGILPGIDKTGRQRGVVGNVRIQTGIGIGNHTGVLLVVVVIVFVVVTVVFVDVGCNDVVFVVVSVHDAHHDASLVVRRNMGGGWRKGVHVVVGNPVIDLAARQVLNVVFLALVHHFVGGCRSNGGNPIVVVVEGQGSLGQRLAGGLFHGVFDIDETVLLQGLEGLSRGSGRPADEAVGKANDR
mmetsp:Transcript_17681/g.36949  ORF Transcript_17681/g.36949 Transcript_17681/m.36949 type:complete len:287 (+) Transcript_17681:1484-2344(+)